MSMSMSSCAEAWMWMVEHEYLVADGEYFVVGKLPTRTHLDQFVAALRLISAWSVDTKSGARKIRCEHDPRNHYRLRWQVRTNNKEML